VEERTVKVVINKEHVAVIDRAVQAVERCWQRWKQELDIAGVSLDGHGDVCIPAGLVPTLAQELDRDGYKVEVQDQREDSLETDEKVIHLAEGPARRYLEALRNHPLGVVEVTGDKDLINKVALLGELYASARVVVAVPTRGLAWKVREELQKESGTTVGLVTAKSRRPGARYTVCTYRSLEKLPRREKNILVVVEAERALDRVVKSLTGKQLFQRVYGMVYTGVTFDEISEMRLKALTGEVIRAASGRTCRARVLMVKSPPLAEKVKGRGLQRKRRMYWENRARNRFAAKIALAFAEKDLAALQECGLHLGEEELPSKEVRVAVLVEFTAHARELRSLLRGWPVLSMVPLELRGREEDKPSIGVSATGRITTLRYGVREGIDADVIVRASGGSGTEVLGELVRLEDQEKHVPILVDFLDEQDEQARNESRRRIGDYRRMGWPVEGPGSTTSY
jgi:hypothetical protein